MALTDKYQPLIDKAKELKIDQLMIEDRGDEVYISGTVHDENEKQQLWDEYERLDPDLRSGDLVLNLQVDGGQLEEYVVKPGDTLSKIAAHHGNVTWTEIYEANRDQIRDPNTIYPGQKLRIPRGA